MCNKYHNNANKQVLHNYIEQGEKDIQSLKSRNESLIETSFKALREVEAVQVPQVVIIIIIVYSYQYAYIQNNIAAIQKDMEQETTTFEKTCEEIGRLSAMLDEEVRILCVYESVLYYSSIELESYMQYICVIMYAHHIIQNAMYIFTLILI